jgi:hypothetical protein
MNKELLKQNGFELEVKLVEHCYCPICGVDCTVENFGDDSSQKEFEISGMCQSCQDKIFA